MKKVIALLALLPILSLSQGGLQIKSLSPDSLCPGDSIHFTVKFIAGTSTAIRMSGPNHGQVWQFTAYYIKQNWPKHFDGTDTVYRLHTVVPASIGDGDTLVVRTAAVPTETYGIVSWCLSTAIQEHSINMSPAIYYDMVGNRVQPCPGALLIERRGNTFRKVIFRE